MYLFPTHTERMLWAFLTWMPGRRKGDVSVVQITFLHQISGHCQGLWSAAHLLSEKGQGTGNVIVSRQYSEREGSRTMRLGVFFHIKLIIHGYLSKWKLVYRQWAVSFCLLSVLFCQGENPDPSVSHCSLLKVILSLLMIELTENTPHSLQSPYSFHSPSQLLMTSQNSLHPPSVKLAFKKRGGQSRTTFKKLELKELVSRHSKEKGQQLLQSWQIPFYTLSSASKSTFP